MRLTSLVFRNVRQPQNENKVPFKAILPLKLRDRVSVKGQGTHEHGCLYEMSLLLTCLEENGYEDKKCIPQSKVLDKCFETHMANKQRTHADHERVKPVPNSKSFTYKQITYLLRKYPTV